MKILKNKKRSGRIYFSHFTKKEIKNEYFLWWFIRNIFIK